MLIGAILSPIADPGDAVRAARAADGAGLDAVGMWDHYHSPRPEWGYVAGWSMLGAMAAATERVKLVPMVINNLHYQLGVLAKESSTLALLSGGRFELGIGAGDWPGSFLPCTRTGCPPGLIEAAAAVRRADGARPSVSVFLSWEWDKWPHDPAGELRTLEQRGASRALVSLGAELPVMVERIASLAAATGPG